MRLSDINPFLRFAELQPSVLSSAPLSCSYDYRIFYILEGTANFVLSDRTVPISADMLIYFRPGTPYYFDGKVKIIVLNFDMTREQSNQKTPRPPSKSVDTFDEKAVFENAPPRELANTVIIEKVAEIGSKMEDCLLHYTYPTAFSDACTSALMSVDGMPVEGLSYFAFHAALSLVVTWMSESASWASKASFRALPLDPS
jgi:hypothetical protein